jgi:hypothetical protein
MPTQATQLRLTLLIIACTFWLSACTPGIPTEQGLESSTPDATEITTIEVTPSPSVEPSSPAYISSPTPVPATPTTPGAGPNPQDEEELARTQYAISAQFDYARHYLKVDETIEYINSAPEALLDLVLLIEPNRWANGFNLLDLKWDNAEPVVDYSIKGNQMRIVLSQPLSPGEHIGLSLSYELELPQIPPPSEDTRPVPYGYTSRQSNVVDWYPFIPPYRPGEGWLAHNPWFFGEHQVYDIADYWVDIELLNPPKDLIIAASAPAEQDGIHYHYELQDGRSFAWSASNQYKVFSQMVGEVTVLSYAFPFGTVGGEAVLKYTAEALTLYSELFGEYPRASLSIVEADFLDGMEYDGLFFLSRGFYDTYDGTPTGYLTAISVHETAHQWWYRLVGNDQAMEPWLDEALCTYAERLYYERHQPEYLDWWWAFRVNYYAPSGWIDGTIYDYGGFLPYRDAVYLRGAQFLEDLRSTIGDEAFLTFLSDYADRMAYRQATADDFFAILEEHTSADLGELRRMYFAP